MKFSLRAITLILLLLAAAATASADTVSLTINNGGTDTLGGVYVGPYNFTENGTTPLQLICDDYTHDVWGGESWTASTSTLPPLTEPLQFQSGTLDQYEQVAWLAQQIFAQGPANSSNGATIGYMQFALWDIFTCGTGGLGSSTCASYGLSAADRAQVAIWYNNALSCYSTGNYSNVVIYTPTTNGMPENSLPQEYIGIIPTPEPGTLLLIGFGLFSLVALRRQLSY